MVHAVSSRSLVGALLSVYAKIGVYMICRPLLRTQAMIPRSSMVMKDGFARNKLQGRSEPQNTVPSLEDFRMGPDSYFVLVEEYSQSGEIYRFILMKILFNDALIWVGSTDTVAGIFQLQRACIPVLNAELKSLKVTVYTAQALARGVAAYALPILTRMTASQVLLCRKRKILSLHPTPQSPLERLLKLSPLFRSSLVLVHAPFSSW